MIYGRIVRDYADQTAVAGSARARLQAPLQAVSSGGAVLRTVGRGQATSISADGRYVTFMHWDSGNIGIRDLRSGTERFVTRRTDYAVYEPVISRDGAFVAFQSFNGCDERQPFVPGSGVLCIVAVDGERFVARTILQHDDITDAVAMDWSPDGRTLAVTLRRKDRTAQIGLVSTVDGSLRVLQSADWRGPARMFFSPDGRHVAFDLPVNDSSDQRDIFVRAVDGSAGTTVVEHPTHDIVMGWSPDGHALLFASDAGAGFGLWAQPLVRQRPEGPPRLIRANLGGVASLGVTSTGALYFMTLPAGADDIEVTSIDVNTGRQVAPPARPIPRNIDRNVMAAWSADGQYLAYVFERIFSPRRIGIVSLATGELRELRPHLSYVAQMSWSPDGHALATSGTDLKGRSGVFTVDTRTGDAVLVVEGTINAYPRWSPDGRRLYYRKATALPTEWAIVERELASGTERVVASGEFGVFNVAPDGKSLAVSVGGLSGSSAHAIIEIRIDTGAKRDLLRAQPGERIPVFIGLPWTPDGGGVLVRKRMPNELWFVPIGGESPRKLNVDVSDWSFGPVGAISLHPDGRRLAYTRTGANISEIMALENFLTSPR